MSRRAAKGRATLTEAVTCKREVRLGGHDDLRFIGIRWKRCTICPERSRESGSPPTREPHSEWRWRLVAEGQTSEGVARGERLVERQGVALLGQLANDRLQLSLPRPEQLLVLQPRERRLRQLAFPLHQPARARPLACGVVLAPTRRHAPLAQPVLRPRVPARVPPVRPRHIRGHLPLLRIPWLLQMLRIVAVSELVVVLAAPEVAQPECPAAEVDRCVGRRNEVLVEEVVHATEDGHVVRLEGHLRAERISMCDQLVRRDVEGAGGDRRHGSPAVVMLRWLRCAATLGERLHSPERWDFGDIEHGRERSVHDLRQRLQQDALDSYMQMQLVALIQEGRR